MIATAASRPVTVEEYVRYREQGFLIVRDLVDRATVDELLAHIDDLEAGRVDVPDAHEGNSCGSTCSTAGSRSTSG